MKNICEIHFCTRCDSVHFCDDPILTLRSTNFADTTVCSHLSDSTENLLLMGVHLCEGADLSQVDVLSVA